MSCHIEEQVRNTVTFQELNQEKLPKFLPGVKMQSHHFTAWFEILVNHRSNLSYSILSQMFLLWPHKPEECLKSSEGEDLLCSHSNLDFT